MQQKDLGNYLAGSEFACLQVVAVQSENFVRVRSSDAHEGYIGMEYLTYPDPRTFFRTETGEVSGYLTSNVFGDLSGARLDTMAVTITLANGTEGTNLVKIREISSLDVEPEEKVTVKTAAGRTIRGSVRDESNTAVGTFRKETYLITGDGTRFPLSKFRGRLIRIQAP